MGIGLGLFDSNNALLLDAAPRAENVEISTNSHGPEALSFDVPLGLWELFGYYDPNGLPTAQAIWNGLVLFKGRMEDRRLKDGLLSVQALGPWRSLSDLPYTALWSATRFDGWRALTSGDRVDALPDRYTFSTQNQLYIAPQKNASLGTTTTNKIGILGVSAPSGSSRTINCIQFDYEFLAPANWAARFQANNDDWSFNATILTLAGSGALQRGSIFSTFTGVPKVEALMFFNAADAVFAGETGSAYFKLTNLRIGTATTNRINTTLTSARTNGAGVTLSVGSTARMYAGQRLIIGSGAANSESLLVTSVTNSTQFVATVVNAPGGGYPIGTTVQAIVIYADEIAADIVGDVAAVNSDQLSSGTALIASPALDLLNESYEDASMADVLTKLAGYGDTAGNLWEVGVGNDQLLFFRVAGSAGRIWYVDASDIDIERTIEALQNSVYAVYQDANGVAVRSTAASDSDSVRRYGLTRQQALSVSSTSSTQATSQVTAALNDGSDPTPRAGIVFDKLYDASGARRLLFEPQANDTLVIRNLPPALATTIDQIRSFRIAHTRYRADDDTLTVEPDIPRPTLEFLLARLAIGAGQTQISKLPVGLY